MSLLSLFFVLSYTLLVVVMFVLKIFNILTQSWLFITSFLWVPVLALVIYLLVIMIVALVLSVVEGLSK